MASDGRGIRKSRGTTIFTLTSPEHCAPSLDPAAGSQIRLIFHSVGRVSADIADDRRCTVLGASYGWSKDCLDCRRLVRGTLVDDARAEHVERDVNRVELSDRDD